MRQLVAKGSTLETVEVTEDRTDRRRLTDAVDRARTAKTGDLRGTGLDSRPSPIVAAPSAHALPFAPTSHAGRPTRPATDHRPHRSHPPRDHPSGTPGPADLRGLTEPQLAELAAEIRETIISTVAETGGHLGSSLGVVELTIACIGCSSRRATGSSGTPATRPTRTSC